MRHLRPILILLTLFFIHSISRAQLLAWQWGQYANSTGNEAALDVATFGPTGDTYVCGYFDGDVSGEFTFGTNGTPLMSTPLAEDGFVAKYDTSGNFLWAFDISGLNNQRATGIAVDAFGDIYVTGYFEGTADFQGTVTSLTLNATANGATQDIFLAKYDSDGNILWLATGSNPDFSTTTDIEVNDDGVFICGSYVNSLLTITDGFGAVDNTSLIAGGDGQDVFVAAFNFDGSQRWLRRASSTGGAKESLYGITANSTHVYVCGTIFNNTTFYDPLFGNQLENALFVGAESMIIASYAESSGALNWVVSAGSTGPDDMQANGIHAHNAKVYVTGGLDDDSGSSISFPGIFNFNLPGSSSDEIFIAQFDTSAQTCDWVNYEINDSPLDARGEDVTVDNSGTIIITGYCAGTTIFNAGNIVSSGDLDLFVSAYDNFGNGQWVRAAQSAAADAGAGIDCDDFGSYYITGNYSDILDISPQPNVPHDNLSDMFVGKIFQCYGPTITSCQADVTVTADPTCNHIIADYTGGITVIDDCGSGISITQEPTPGSSLSAGQHTIALIATDGSGLDDTCYFTLTIEADVNPTVVECGDLLVGETTFGNGNNQDTWSCTGVSTPGEDIYYQVTVPSGNYLLGITITNAADINDAKINVQWIGGSCPLTSSCIFADEYDISQGDFDSNNQNQLVFSAVGPGTYYFVVDAQIDGIDSYDIQFDCITSGVEFDETGCGSDTNNDGVYSTVNGSGTLTVQPCQNVTICNEIYVQNVNAGEWLDTVVMDLGPCHTNITNTVPDLPGPNGTYDAGGSWNAVVDVMNNSIEWGFDHSTTNPWGDGFGSNYNCRTYQFCFDADISATCQNNDSLNIEILITDDHVNGLPTAAPGFDYATASGFNLFFPNAGWNYGGFTSWCQADSDPVANVTGTPGGTFSATAGLVWANQTLGIIDLSASSTGNHNVTYTVGSCGTDSTFSITINPMQDASVTYANTSLCNNAGPEDTLSVGVSGGTFSTSSVNLFVNGISGQINPALSTPGVYQVYYTSPGPLCANVDSVQITILPEDDASFGYSGIVFCNNDPDEDTVFVGTSGGTFSDNSPNLAVNAINGTIDINSSLPGSYQINYTTPGPLCPNIDSVSITINPTDNASVVYATSAFCNNDGPVDTLSVGDSGGTFSANSGNISVNGLSGQINPSTSLPGVYQIYYTTPGPLCPATDSVQITINPEDDPSFGYASTGLCNHDPLMDTAFTNTPGGTFSDNSTFIVVNSISGQIDPSSSVPGVYQVYYTTPGPACPNIDSVQITINEEDDPFFTYNTTIFCNNDAVEDTSVVGTSGGTFSANSANLDVDPISGQINPMGSLPGVYQVYYNTPGPSCPNIDSTTITINAEDDATFTYTSYTYCDNDLPADTLSVGTSGGTFTSGTMTIHSVSGQLNLIASPPGVHTAYYITPGPNCPNVDSVQITINPMDDASFSYVTPMCGSGPNQSPDFVALPGGTYNETSGNITFANPNGTIDIANSNAGVHTVEYTTNGTCPNTSTFDVEIYPVIDPVFYLPDSICLNNPVINLNDSTNLQGAETDIFYSYGNSPGPASLSGINNNLLDPSASGVGTFNVTHVIQNGIPGCVDSMSLVLEILPVFNADYSNVDTLCKSYGIYNMNNFFSGSTDPGGSWSGIGVYNDSLWNVASLPSGTYSLTYAVGIGICTDSVTKSIYIKPDLDSSWTAPADMCDNAPQIDLSGSITGDPGGIWIGNGMNGSVFNPSAAGPGNHTITYMVGDSLNCSESNPQIINVLATPIADAGVDDEVCDTSYNLLSNSNISAGYWLANNEGVFFPDSSYINASVSVSSYGTHKFYWFVDQNGLCSSIDSIEVTFNEAPTSDAGQDQYLDFEFETDLSAVSPAIGVGEWSLISGNGDIWNPSDSLSHVSNLMVGENIFRWAVVNGNCPAAEDDVSIFINDIWVPEAITPNGDGVNDYLEVKGIENSENHVQIFNRWGQLVYEQSNYQNDWDGYSSDGVMLEDETYFYIIKVNNDRIFNGYIVLKR